MCLYDQLVHDLRMSWISGDCHVIGSGGHQVIRSTVFSLFKIQGLIKLQRLTFPCWRYVPAVVQCRPSVLGPKSHSSRSGDDNLGVTVHIVEVVLRSLGSHDGACRRTESGSEPTRVRTSKESSLAQAPPQCCGSTACEVIKQCVVQLGSPSHHQSVCAQRTASVNRA